MEIASCPELSRTPFIISREVRLFPSNSLPLCHAPIWEHSAQPRLRRPARSANASSASSISGARQNLLELVHDDDADGLQGIQGALLAHVIQTKLGLQNGGGGIVAHGGRSAGDQVFVEGFKTVSGDPEAENEGVLPGQEADR